VWPRPFLRCRGVVRPAACGALRCRGVVGPAAASAVWWCTGVIWLVAASDFLRCRPVEPGCRGAIAIPCWVTRALSATRSSPSRQGPARQFQQLRTRRLLEVVCCTLVHAIVMASCGLTLSLITASANTFRCADRGSRLSRHPRRHLLTIHSSERLCRITSFGCSTSLETCMTLMTRGYAESVPLRQAYLCQLHRRVAFVASYRYCLSAISPEKQLRQRQTFHLHPPAQGIRCLSSCCA
jgi:hypothetical protein